MQSSIYTCSQVLVAHDAYVILERKQNHVFARGKSSGHDLVDNLSVICRVVLPFLPGDTYETCRLQSLGFYSSRLLNY